jgi:prepilin-type N-terminal cleavage/methylation domain-containing protein
MVALRGSHGRESGFTLVEMLVSLAILSVMMVALYGAIGDSAHRLSQAQAESMAVGLARSKMDEVGHTIPAIVGDVSGAEGRFTWQVSIGIHGTPEERVAWPAVLADVTVSVRWGEGVAKRSLSVHTFKLLPKG